LEDFKDWKIPEEKVLAKYKNKNQVQLL
jgi:hypothetical protein